MGKECTRRGASIISGMSQGTTTPAADLRRRVEHVLELIRPTVRADGGDLELVDVTQDGIVQVRFLGACVGCPSSGMTLKHGIEQNIRTHVPEAKGVQAVP